MKLSYKLLTISLVVGAILRLIYLGSIPVGFTPDEASQGYTAYSILKTGRDEWGNFLPLSSFKSFLDYKAPLQTYLMVPAIAVFGLNEFSVRLPSAVFGILSIYALYLLCQKLFPKHPKIAGLAALLLAISPWHIQFSRMALEVNLTSLLIPLGLYLFLKGEEDEKFYIFSLTSFGIGLYAYHAARLFIPLFGLFLILNSFKNIKKISLNRFLTLIFVTAIFIAPIATDMIFGGSSKRGADVMITKMDRGRIQSISNAAYFSDLKSVNPILPRVFHNKLTSLASQFVENYLSYFSLPFWFTEGGREITYSIIPGRGLLHFWVLPLVLTGIYLLLSNKELSKSAKILIFWGLIAAIPAALTKEGYRPNRAGSFLVYWELIAAIGLYFILEAKFKFKKLFFSAFFGLSVLLTIFYFEDYFFNSKVTYPRAMAYGWRDVVKFVSGIENNYEQVMVDKGTQSQSFFAFYQKTDPVKFQNESSNWQKKLDSQPVAYLDQLDQYSLGKYNFQHLNWPDDRSTKALFVYQGNSGGYESLPGDRRKLFQITEPLGSIIIEVFDFPK